MQVRSLLVFVLVLASLGLGACSRFRIKSSYESARPGRALEIPPDLASPSTLGALTIPGAGGGSSAAAPSASPGSMSSTGPLVLADQPAAAWKRVGLAIERSAVGSLVSKDEAAATYTVKIAVGSAEKKGFFRRMFSSGANSPSSVTRVVHVLAEGSGARVQIEDEAGNAIADDAARRLLDALKDRLG